ncbi:hypothetical protein JRQ81_004208 [Phrynocephalus forsythii]|uniref:UBZ3-type domain-containing protein n=1 Tax=Phrynocephalus forsythii TaxID=171643 RepID=A0A9Q0Y361_9SAUR|nr:hypothetical protein JRQ81_004208 [Phrynocephalus forsythii]
MSGFFETISNVPLSACRTPPVTLLQLSATKFSEANTLSSVDITSFLTSDSQRNPSTSTTAESPNAKSLGSPKRRPAKRLAAERKQAQALSGFSVPRIANEKTVQSATETSSCHDQEASVISDQIPEDPVEPVASSSKPDTTLAEATAEQSVQSNEAGLGKTSVTSGRNCLASLEAGTLAAASELLDASQEVSVQPLQREADILAPPFVDDWMLCEKCSQQVLVWEFPEHLDYHLAVELQNSFSGSSSCRTPVPVGSPPTKGKSKSRSHTVTSAKRPRQDTTRTLDSFFKCLPP